MSYLGPERQAKRGSFIATSLALIFLSSCASQNHGGPSTEAQLSDIRRIQAEQTTLIASLRDDIRELNGRLDEMEHRSEALKDLSQNIQTIESRLPPPEGVPLSELDASQKVAQKNNDTLLSESLTFIRKGQYKDAIPSLERAISQNGANAYYSFWLGVANENFGYLEKSLGYYHEVATNFPKESLAPVALLRQSNVFIKLADKVSAKLTLQKIISSYPKTPSADLARSRVKGL